MQVDFLLRDRKCYTYENYAADQLKIAFGKLGVHVNKIEVNISAFREYMLALQERTPDWTLGFEDLFRMTKPFCDIIQVPHFFWERTSLSNAVAYLDSSYGHIGFGDLSAAQAFDLQFLPHAVDPELKREDAKYLFDVVFFSDLIDLERKEMAWKEIFSEEVAILLKEAVLKCKQNPDVHPLMLARTLKTDAISLNDLVAEIEEYLRAEKIQELIESLKEVRVDVFGEHVGNNWLKKLRNKENVRLHFSLPYTEYLEVLKLSKVLVRYQPPFNKGSDEWILPGLRLGCAVLTNPNPYLKTLLDEKHFYTTSDELYRKTRAFLVEEDFKIDEKIFSENSWETRAKQIFRVMHS